ncbi:MAG: chromosome segregation SMC family protein [Candidatus Fonsibacter sp.]|nr:chromosome segregation protein SMC [Pelagibacterales bacterium]
MKFTKLDIVGFKSFADRTQLLIEDGLTGVVGPNGCGKSNVVEALRWCMGETSAKSLRGSGMEDVIFSGTSNRPSKNIAEVTIQLDNKDKKLQGSYKDLTEIEVRRRIEIDKGSKFFINGKEVRARDVQILFADLSTGPHSPSMVSQGKVGSLITAKPVERRAILEEAAGILGLHARRHEAELRLDAAENNLKKADDIMKQLSNQLKNLLKQAEEASRYKNISEEIRKQEIFLVFAKVCNIKKDLKNNHDQLEEIEDNISALNIEKNYNTENLDAEIKKTKPLRDEYHEISSKLQRLNLEYEDLFKEEKRSKEESEKLKLSIKNSNEDLQTEIISLNNSKSNIERLQNENDELLNIETNFSKNISQLEIALKEAQTVLEQEQQNFENILKGIFENLKDEAGKELKIKLSQIKELIDNEVLDVQDIINEINNFNPTKIKNYLDIKKSNLKKISDLIQLTNERYLAHISKVEGFNDINLQNNLLDKTLKIKDLQSNYSKCSNNLEVAKSEIEKRKQRINNIQNEIKNWETVQQSSDIKIKNLKVRISNLEIEADKLQTIPIEVGEKKGTYTQNIRNTEEKRNNLNHEIESSEKKLQDINKGLNEINNKLLEETQKKVRFETQIENFNQQIKEYDKKVLEDNGSTLDNFLSDEDKKNIELSTIDKLEENLKDLKNKRETMGSVNLKADDDTKEIEKQIEKMMNDRKDLVSGIVKLKSSINELNQRGRERLIDAYEKVSRKFNDVYTKLFGGGSARLELIESDDPLEAGLELLVSPPGKKLQSITLLSGGEQALTALALIFAVFLTNPAPICVLDEVDAPLDDANVTRFCSLIDELTKITETKFIVITHHAFTMSRMHRLYGVTMAERGVSQLVAVDLEKAEEMKVA